MAVRAIEYLHFLNQLIFPNVVIQISVAQTSVEWFWHVAALRVTNLAIDPT
jgi:hypothetical protein